MPHPVRQERVGDGPCGPVAELLDGQSAEADAGVLDGDYDAGREIAFERGKYLFQDGIDVFDARRGKTQG